MVCYMGKCASCGVGKNHKNFRGCQEGRLVPDPCFVSLWKHRGALDDRLCNKCYKSHLANMPAEPVTPATPVESRRRSSASSLDGVHWSETSSERVAKVARLDADGTPVIPVVYHEQRLGEMKNALRSEQITILEQCRQIVDEQMESDQLQTIFLRDDLSDVERATVFRRVLQYYKEKPSAERARLFQDLSNAKAGAIAGISPTTLARARKLEFSSDTPKPPRKARVGVSRGGFTREEVREIAFEACFNQRFCEVRAWKTHTGDHTPWHWESIGLVDIKTMWQALCHKHGEDFCSLRNFYRLMPDFFVNKKKERCVCAHCKQGRRYLDYAALLINALRHSVGEKHAETSSLIQLRYDLILLYGHLDKEIVIEVADKRHKSETKNCAECELLHTIPQRAASIAALLEEKLKISRSEWGIVFPGVEFSSTSKGRSEKVVDFFSRWENETQKYVEHLFLKADRIKELESDIEHLAQQPSAEVWFSDYMMTLKLVGTVEETEADFLSKETANNLGFMRIYWANGALWREYWDFVFQGSKDIQGTIQIQKQFLKQIKKQRKEQSLPALTCLKIWADNATDFKGGDAWDQWQKELKLNAGLQSIVFNYHAEGEGKTGLDAHFGHLHNLMKKRERQKLERRTVKDLLDAMVCAEATHVVHVQLDRDDEGRFYKTAPNIKRFHQVVVSKDHMKGKESSRSEVEEFVLSDIKERKTKRSRQKKASMQPKHKVFSGECQKCHNQLKDGDEWMECDSCDRSWHKTCVGIAANTPNDSAKWHRWGTCGGADPEGETLQNRRKPPVCAVCGRRLKGVDHKPCKGIREDEVTLFTTPSAVVISAAHHPVSRKPAMSARQKRKLRGKKKRRSRSSIVMSEKQFQQLAKRI